MTFGRQEGTWGWIIGRYLHDEYSSFHDVGEGTKKNYRKALAQIEKGIGSVRIKDTDYPRIMKWQRSMRDNGRSTAYIKRWFTHWGLALSHGVKIGDEECARVRLIRSEMRIQNAPARNKFLTREQVEAIVDEADRRGAYHISLSLLFRFEFLLRGVDVYGEWEPLNDRKGGVQHNGNIWVKGLTWEMFDQNLTKFSKVISKTRKSLPEPYTFDLTNVPALRERLLKIPKEKRVGPVIIVKSGRPPSENAVTNGFKRVLRHLMKDEANAHLNLTDGLRMSDARSGGITEAKSLVDPMMLRDAAQHTQISTTDRYVRGRSDAANNVVAIRGGRTNK
jgi:hypothetical protein